MPARATSRDALKNKLAGLIAEEDTDITGVAKVETNDGTTKEEKGLPEDGGPGRLAQDGALPKALNKGTPPIAPTSEADELSKALEDATMGPD